MTTKTDDIKLPPLPRGDIAADTCPVMWVHTDQQIENYAREAIEADRQRRREPVGRVKTVGGYPDDSEHTIEWLCKHKDLKDGDYLYTAPQPAQQVQGGPVAWVTVDTVDGQTVNGKSRRIWWENNDGVGMPIYAAPQPTPDVSALVEALRLAKEMFIANDLILPHTFEVIDEAIEAYRKQDEKQKV